MLRAKCVSSQMPLSVILASVCCLTGTAPLCHPSAMVRKTILALCPLVHRPCAMVVPDFELICEIMLVAEGFIEARALARKFITLYRLCKELLSKQVLSLVTLDHQSRVIAPPLDGARGRCHRETLEPSVNAPISIVRVLHISTTKIRIHFLSVKKKKILFGPQTYCFSQTT